MTKYIKLLIKSFKLMIKYAVPYQIH